MMDIEQSKLFLNEWIKKTGAENWSDLHHCVKMVLCRVEEDCKRIAELEEALVKAARDIQEYKDALASASAGDEK